MSRVRGKWPVHRLDRNQKAAMIDAVLAAGLGSSPRGLHILDIGSGNGDISRWFSARGNQVDGVDVEDKRKPGDAEFAFTLVSDEDLPFTDDTFDVVLSHHVIEHVGDQRRHLAEIHRVLQPEGMAYLATPNKSSPLMQGHVGNDMVLRHQDMRPLFESVGFMVREMSVDIVKQGDRFHSEYASLRPVPRWILRLGRRWYPSHVFLLRPEEAPEAIGDVRD